MNRALLTGLLTLTLNAAPACADVYINLLAVNGADEVRETPIKYNLPSELKAEDIVDTDGLNLEYNVSEGAHVVSGTVKLEPKATKSFRIRIRDLWKISPSDVDQIKKEIDEGYARLVRPDDKATGDVLKQELLDELDFIVKQQSGNADSVEKRISAYRTYKSQVDLIRRSALSVDYWRSEPGELKRFKTVRMVIEVENSADEPKPITHQHYLPAEVKPEHVVSREDFEIRFEKEKERSYLYKEEELQAKEKKRYEIQIKDIWQIPKKDLDYLDQRTTYAYNVLKDTPYEQGAQYLTDRITANLQSVNASQGQQREIREHIKAFRVNEKLFEATRLDVEALEKLVAVYREELEKTKVENVLQKVKSLNSIGKVSDAIFNKKPKESTAWSMIGKVLIFLGIFTLINFVIWLLRSNAEKKKKKAEEAAAGQEEELVGKKK